MVKLCELSSIARESLVQDVSDLLMDKYHIDRDSIIELWDTMSIGVHARERA